MAEEFLTVADIAELLKVNPQTVRNWIDRRALPAVRVGPRRVRVMQSDLDAFTASTRQDQTGITRLADAEVVDSLRSVAQAPTR
jgi:excisionase family DNA binding protein